MKKKYIKLSVIIAFIMLCFCCNKIYAAGYPRDFEGRCKANYDELAECELFITLEQFLTDEDVSSNPSDDKYNAYVKFRKNNSKNDQQRLDLIFNENSATKTSIGSYFTRDKCAYIFVYYKWGGMSKCSGKIITGGEVVTMKNELRENDGGWGLNAYAGLFRINFSSGGKKTITFEFTRDSGYITTVKFDVEVKGKTELMEEKLLQQNPPSDFSYVHRGQIVSLRTTIENAVQGQQKQKWPGRYQELEDITVSEPYKDDPEFKETKVTYLVYEGEGDDEKIYMHSCSIFQNSTEGEYVYVVIREDKTDEYKVKSRDEEGNIITDEEVEEDADEGREEVESIIYDAYEATKITYGVSGFRETAPFKDVLEFIGDYKPDDMDPDTSGKVEEISSKVLSVVTNIGMVVTVLIIALLGIKYMLGSVEEKAEYKKDLVPVLIGALLLFGVVAFVKIFMELGIQISNI